MSGIEFRIGGRVVCVDDHFGRWNRGAELPLRGVVYTIRGFLECPDGLSVWLDEIVSPRQHWRDVDTGCSYDCEPTFRASRFRPVRETSIDCFTKLLEKQPELVGGDA